MGDVAHAVYSFNATRMSLVFFTRNQWLDTAEYDAGGGDGGDDDGGDGDGIMMVMMMMLMIMVMVKIMMMVKIMVVKRHLQRVDSSCGTSGRVWELFLAELSRSRGELSFVGGPFYF